MAAMAAVAMCGTSAILSTSSSSAHGLRSARPSRTLSRIALAGGRKRRRSAPGTRALMDLRNDPIVKEALKEPVAFLGGVFAGLLRLDLNEDPLREWIAKTADAAGVKSEESKSGPSEAEGPTEIQID